MLGGVGEECAVFVVYDEYWEIRVGFAEFGEELVVEGVVDGFPEPGAAGEDRVDVAGGRLSTFCQQNTKTPRKISLTV